MFEKAIQSTWISEVENQAKPEEMENIVVTAEIVIEQTKKGRIGVHQEKMNFIDFGPNLCSFYILILKIISIKCFKKG